MTLTLDHICARSEDVVSRIIEDELIIVPLVAGIGESDEDIYSMNETGRAIWSLFDDLKSLRDVVDELADQFESDRKTIEQDVLGLVEELLKRKLVTVR